jgi:hypothetical protein
VSPKRTKSFKWTVNIVHATLEGLKNSIRAMYQTPALENDGAVFNIVNDSGKYSPRNDQDLREMLRIFVSRNNLKFTVFIETPSKAFSDWTFPKVCELYGLSDDPNPDIDVFPVFSCGSAELDSEKSKAVVKHLMAELNLRKKTTPIAIAYEATKSIYSYCYLAGGVSLYDNNFKIVPEKLVKGHNGQGKLDLAVECRSTGRIAGLIEVKDYDFKQGLSQASVQMESCLTCRKRKANEISDEYDMDKVWGIVTDGEKWFFMECTLGEDERPSFKLSIPVVVAYDDENMENMVRKVFSHIVWLMGEVRSPEDLRSVKRVKSSDNLTGNTSNTETN